MYILGIETSCDETAAAVLTFDGKILSNIVSSQIPIHAEFGGVVPEIASRNHVISIDSVVKLALEQANIKPYQLTQIAATTEPGLPGAVLVGRVFGESLATALGIPFHPINHVIGHIASVYLQNSFMPEDMKIFSDSSNAGILASHIALVISGGHTALYNVAKNGIVKTIESTLDDAIGEAFDKVARILNLPYPGGPQIERLAKEYTETEFIQFVAKPNYAINGFSYSGLKTAVLNHVNRLKQKNEPINFPQICASFQREAIAQLVFKIKRAFTKKGGVCRADGIFRKLSVSGGVSINKNLQQTLTTECEKIDVTVYFPPLELCGDNAAMISAAAILDLKMFLDKK